MEQPISPSREAIEAAARKLEAFLQELPDEERWAIHLAFAGLLPARSEVEGYGFVYQPILAAAAPANYAWHEDFVLDGAAGNDSEKGGSLDPLNPSISPTAVVMPE